MTEHPDRQIPLSFHSVRHYQPNERRIEFSIAGAAASWVTITVATRET
ncbi:hypothetical protein QNH14_00050 [Apirhabdus apintestini]|nr:hypothetical protein QNH14_00050 [Enterobacteriaceae bacterium CA-0114]